ncbi:MAG: hypothetical protein ACK5MQ_18030 [Pikeienuella sp.]
MRHAAAVLVWLSAPAAAGAGLCETASGAPQPAAALLAAALAAGPAIHVERFDLRDRDGDGRADIVLMMRDESYNGAPVYDLTYYRGEAAGFCGRLVFSGRASLGGAPYDLTFGEMRGGYPDIRFRFDEADPASRTVRPATQIFRFDAGEDAYSQTG